MRDFVGSDSRVYTQLTSGGVGSAIKEDLDELLHIRKTYFPKKDYPLAWK